MPDADATYAVIDLEHTGRSETVAACLLRTRDGPVVVDPGPASTLPRLRAGLARHGYEVADLSALLLTHIHLDHAGASGTLARENPRLRVFVSDRGAAHVVDPAKLLKSATRLYGDRMDELWGEVAPVSAGQVRPLAGGESLALGGRNVRVLYTPGHATHHVSYFEPESGVAFVGDTAGFRAPGSPAVFPLTPPPDFDLEAWLDSTKRILAVHPAELVLTHFGPSPDPERHMEELRSGLVAWAGHARESLSMPGSEAERIGWFVDRIREWAAERLPAGSVERTLDRDWLEAAWRGLARYWTQLQAPTATAGP